MYGKVFFKNYYYEFMKKFDGTSTCSYLKSLFQEICKIIFKIIFDNLLCRQEFKPEVVNWNFNLHNTKCRVHLYRSLQIVSCEKEFVNRIFVLFCVFTSISNPIHRRQTHLRYSSSKYLYRASDTILYIWQKHTNKPFILLHNVLSNEKIG